MMTGGNTDIYDEYTGRCDMSDWADIIAVAVEDDRIVGLLNNGTVVATGDNEVGQCDVSDWTDVIAVAVNYIDPPIKS